MLSTDNQVVSPQMRDFNFPASSGYGHPSPTLVSISASHSYLYGVPPSLVKCGRSHDSRVTTISIVVGLARPGLIIPSLARPSCATLISSLLIPSPNLTLFLLNCAHSSSSAWCFKLPLRMDSCNCRIPLPRSLHSV